MSYVCMVVMLFSDLFNVYSCHDKKVSLSCVYMLTREETQHIGRDNKISAY